METLEELYSQEFEAMEMLQARRSFEACGGLEGLPQLIAAASSQEEVQRYIEVAAAHCNQYGHPPGCNKGTTREMRDKSPDKRLVIDDSLTGHEKVAKLANLLEQARKDGVRLEVEIPGAAWGDTLILPSGRSDPAQKAGAHGVKHALEERHHITAKDVADTLLHGEIYPNREHPEHRTDVYKTPFLVVLEREINKGGGRVSHVTAKLHTAMKDSSYLKDRDEKQKGGA